MKLETTAVIFDFNNSLCSEQYFRLLDHPTLATIDALIFRGDTERWCHPWIRGELSNRDVAVYLSEHLSHTAETIVIGGEVRYSAGCQ